MEVRKGVAISKASFIRNQEAPPVQNTTPSKAEKSPHPETLRKSNEGNIVYDQLNKNGDDKADLEESTLNKK